MEPIDGALLGFAIRKLRRAQKPVWTQKEVAERAEGVSSATVAHLETGRIGEPTQETADALARVFGYASARDMLADTPISAADRQAVRARRNDWTPDQVNRAFNEGLRGALSAMSPDRQEVRLTGDTMRVPMVAEASAGRGESARIVGDVEIPSSWGRGRSLIAVRIRGQCMVPRLLPGDIVLFEKMPDDQLPDGAMVLVTLLDELHEGAYVVKYLEWARNGEDKVLLTAEDGTEIDARYDRVVIEGRFFKLIRE
jgi:transcriptional regulator with XRE-family HTH domain